MTSTNLFPSPTQIESEEAAQVLKEAEFRADPFHGKELTKESLLEAGLLPVYKLDLQHTCIYLSSLYLVLGNRAACIGYIKTEKECPIIRSFYRSNSQGVWRYLVDYRLKNGFFDWYAQGHASDNITASIAMQKGLGAIEQNPTSFKRVENSDFILAGTARERKQDRPYVGSAGKPVKIKGTFYPTKDSSHPAPESLTFTDDSHEPDFSKRLTSWTKNTEVYGDISVEIFPSHDESLYFMFCKDNQSRAWIAHVETAKGSPSSTGVMTPWIDAGQLVTPAYEYTTLANHYGNSDKRKGPYVDMFSNYLSKIPIIQKYLHTS